MKASIAVKDIFIIFMAFWLQSLMSAIQFLKFDFYFQIDAIETEISSSDKNQHKEFFPN